MTWIREIGENEAKGVLKSVYEKVGVSRGRVSNIFRVQSLDPDSMKAHLELYLRIMFGQGGLSRRQREMIAVAVSAENKCGYCVAHHSAALRNYVNDDRFIESLTNSPETATADPKERAMVSYAMALTRNPASMTEAHIQSLQSVGMKDEEILHLALVASYFNFVNRLASGLGVSLEEEGQAGYKY